MPPSGFRIRVDDQLREQFISICRSQDMTAAQVLRAYMRDYVERHHTDDQIDLFEEMISEGDPMPFGEGS